MQRRRSVLVTLGGAVLAGCGTRSPGRPTSDTVSTTDHAPSRLPTVSAVTTPDDVRYPAVRASGNPVVDGMGRLPAAPIDVPLDAPPAWVVAAPAEHGSLWVVVDISGDATAVVVDAGEPRRVDVTPTWTGGPAPPLLLGGDGQTAHVLAPPASTSRLTHPTVLGDGSLLVATDDGRLARVGDDGSQAVDVTPLPDSRIRVADEWGVVLAGPTDQYGHGVLGDRVEASEVVVLDLADGLAVRARIDVAPAVVEGIAPLLADLDDDGRVEVVVTESDRERGARLVAHSLDGERLGAGPAVGRGFRWRHQLAVAPLGPGGETELVGVETPHIGGVVGYHRLRDGRLAVVAERSGYSTHAIGSRVLAGALAADLDGDGAMELLVPTQDRRTLVALRRTRRGAGVTEVFRVAAGGIRTNLTGTRTGTGEVAVGVGTDDRLRVWV